MVGQDLGQGRQHPGPIGQAAEDRVRAHETLNHIIPRTMNRHLLYVAMLVAAFLPRAAAAQGQPTMYGPSIVAEQAKPIAAAAIRSEEHTSELQSPDTISYAVFCLKKKN